MAVNSNNNNNNNNNNHNLNLHSYGGTDASILGATFVLTLEDGAARPCRNACKQLPTNTKDLILSPLRRRHATWDLNRLAAPHRQLLLQSCSAW